MVLPKTAIGVFDEQTRGKGLQEHLNLNLCGKRQKKRPDFRPASLRFN